MAIHQLPIIAGAGPVGLTAALLLRLGGIDVRLIEKSGQARSHSRALVVNPRTLELLEPTGVTDRLLEIGLKLRGAQFWADDKPLKRLSFDTLPGDWKYMLAVSQSVSERLLRDALQQAGGTMERGTELIDCRPTDGGVSAELRHSDESDRPVTEQASAPWLLAADGAHGVGRVAIETPFVGSTFARPWYLADVPLHTSLPQDEVHLVFLPGGRFLFVARVVDDEPPTASVSPATAAASKVEPASAAPLWRVMGNLRDPAMHVPRATVAGPAVWASHFTIEHRIVRSMQQGPIALAGDAAHVHSPVGARGMNLGIEDAWVFARLVLAGRSAEYGRMRRRVDAAVVRRVLTIARIARGESTTSRLIRRWGLPALFELPPVRRKMLQTVSGLDHELPKI